MQTHPSTIPEAGFDLPWLLSLSAFDIQMQISQRFLPATDPLSARANQYPRCPCLCTWHWGGRHHGRVWGLQRMRNTVHVRVHVRVGLMGRRDLWWCSCDVSGCGTVGPTPLCMVTKQFVHLIHRMTGALVPWLELTRFEAVISW